MRQKGKVRRQQPRKDSKSKRINLDNERDSRFVKDEIKDIACSSKSNDVRWYAHSSELLRSAASLPFSTTTGQVVGFPGSQQTVPGILSLNWEPTFGDAELKAINAAKESMYSYVVHANSRNTTYDPADLMLTVVAGMQIFAAIGAAIRAYGTMKMYDQRNSYLPKGLILAMGFDFDDLQKNLSQMWFDINEMVARSSQIWIPNTLPVMERWFWMNQNVYMDSATVKGQYYVMTQRKYLQLSETANPNGTSLIAVTTPAGPIEASTPCKWAQYKTMLNAMFTALLDSQDRGTIMGDILKAYGAEKIFALSEVPVNYVVAPVYDREVLTQIENSTCFGSSISGASQTTEGFIEFNWENQTGNFSSKLPPDHAVLNFHQLELPLPEQIMVATRLMCLGYRAQFDDSSVLTQIIPYTMGTEFVNNYQIIRRLPNGSLQSTNLAQYYTSSSTPLNDYANWTAFDWSPWIYQLANRSVQIGTTTSNTVSSGTVSRALGDWDYYTTIDDQTLFKMNTTALYSEFDVPTL